jgi:hypothetical protein
LKKGGNVRRNEKRALDLVAELAPDNPVPKVYGMGVSISPEGDEIGSMFMSFIEGRTLKSV